MSRQRLVYLCSAVFFVACADADVSRVAAPGFDAGVVCEDVDRDGFGRDCARGFDCDDSDPRITNECRSCNKPELGCACAPGSGPLSCFLPDTPLPEGDVMCREGTRYCRNEVWSGCESVHAYVVAPKPDPQRVVDPSAGQATCSVCDLKCFKVVDNLLSDGGTAGGDVTFGPGGGLTLLPGSGTGPGMQVDAGPSGLTGCAAMAACCSTLSGPLKTGCDMTANSANNMRCDNERPLYCPPGTVTGPVTGCTLGSGADRDCDGIPDVVDYPGKPISTTNNRTIFHQLDVGETGQNSLDIAFKLRNADVYFLLDMTNTMKEERDNLISSLTNGNVVNCAHLNQCCNRESDPGKKKSCEDAFDSYTNRKGLADDQVGCLSAESTYCPGNKPIDCPDNDFDGLPDNSLKEQGVVGAVRCLVGSSWFGAGYARELPILRDPEGCSGSTCGAVDYGDRDEHIFRHIVDMTNDASRVRTALASMLTNGNHDEPEGGMMALYSAITGRGHYFGINRPAVPARLSATGCPPNSFGYPCFRRDSIPIVVFFTDRPHHNGPNDPTNCRGQGVGCPYNKLVAGSNPGTWTSGSSESSTDKQARRVPADAESFSTAYNVGEVRGQYVSLVGDTRFMAGDYPTAIIGCGADAASPDALIRFRVSPPAGATGVVPPVSVNFHLTKDDAYAASKYGTWSSGRTNDPSPATEFGSVIAVFRGVPNVVSSVIDNGDRTAVAIASGPDSTYLTYTGKTNGAMSMAGFLGGISGCGADGATNQVLFTFRPTSNAHVVVDAAESGYPTTVSLHEGLPNALPKNPNAFDDTSRAIVNTNDTFATANVVPGGSGPIDGVYVERTANSGISTITPNYTAMTPLYVRGQRTQGSVQITNLSSTSGLYVGMPLSSSTSWSSSPVRITGLQDATATVSATWNGTTDASPVELSFDDSLVGCGVDPQGRDAVFKFNVATPRRVRIDTEGSSYDTVISLHDDPPPSVVSRTDVSGNNATPGYAIGDVTNASYTVSDVGSGTNALTNKYDYLQCGAVAAAKDAAFTFQLTKPTRLGLDVTSNSWDPVVALFGSQPGTATVLSNAANKNDRIAPPLYVPFNVGDVFGQLDTRVTGSNLTGSILDPLLDDYSPATVGCGAIAGGRDQIFQFISSTSTTVRIAASPIGGWLPVVSVFDDPPAVGGAVTTAALFDAATAALPDSNCLVYSYHDPVVSTARTYAVCPSRRYADDANARCVSAGMNYLVSVNSADEQAFLLRTNAATTTGSNFHIGAVDLDGDGIFAWRDGSALGYNNWATGEPNDASRNNKCADMTPAGTWLDGKCTSSGAATSDNAYYICEDVTPATAPPEDAATAYVVNAVGTSTIVTGSTRRMSSDYNGATLLGACGGTIDAGDAVFRLGTGLLGFTISIDSAGSSYSPVLGLFEGAVDAAGYRACDAPGGMPLEYPLIAGRTYYLLVKGTAASPEGNYKLKFSDKNSLTSSGVRLACAPGTASVPKATTDVDVDANHTYYVVVDQANASFGAYDLTLNALYRNRAEVGNAAPSNENGGNALGLPDPYRSRITVVDTSTAGMVADYGVGAQAMCSASPSAPDAVYKVTPSLPTNLTFTVTPQGAGLSGVAIGVFDGLPGTSAVRHDLNAAGNPNEALSSSETVPFNGPAQQYFGNTSAMAPNVDASLLACGAYPNGRDAVFGFRLDKTTNVEIDASESTVSNPVINLFRSSPLSRPTQVTLENDSKQAADTTPQPTPTATSSWLYYGADMNNLTAESQTQLSMMAINSEASGSQPQDLGDIAGKRITVGGGDTSPMLADYPGNWSCGGSDAAPDAIYKLYSSTNSTLRVRATPASGFDTVLGLFDGTNGPPRRLSDVSSVIEDNACVPSGGPKNLTNATLKQLSPMAASAPAVNLNCGATIVVTTDPDGAGPGQASFNNWCGTQPLSFVQAQPGGPELLVFLVKNLTIATGSSLRVIGARPVVFVVTQNAAINGTLSVSPDQALYPGVPGAGGDFACGTSLGGNANGTSTNT
ncbi:MAG: lectin-like protein, partial [Polyangiales bacterium]